MNKLNLKNPVRIVTAASLFDGHDASINIMRRLIQDAGAEVIHLGHNRSVMDIVTTILQEGAQGVCISSYQGGHMEFFKYMKDLLKAFGAGYVKIYGGGGGVIVPDEKKELEAYGIDQIFHPEDGRRLGLNGMIQLVVEGSDFDLLAQAKEWRADDQQKLVDQVTFQRKIEDRARGLALTAIELGQEIPDWLKKQLPMRGSANPPVLGVTGTGGAGKSSLLDEITQRFLNLYSNKKISLLCVDPTKKRTGGSLLGDRIRMNSLERERTYMRSIASRGSGNETAKCLPAMIEFLKKSSDDLLVVETSGIGQADSAVSDIADVKLYVMTSEFGAQSQLEKIDMIDYADLIAINKADRKGSQDALRDVRKQYRRSRQLPPDADGEGYPVFLTQASNFNDQGVNQLFFALSDKLAEYDPSKEWGLSSAIRQNLASTKKQTIIPPERQNYLSEIVKSVRSYKSETQELAQVANDIGAFECVAGHINEEKIHSKLSELLKTEKGGIISELRANYKKLYDSYQSDELAYAIRGKEFKSALTTTSLSGTRVKRVAVPRLTNLGDQVRYLRLENVPGEFPFTSGVFVLKRSEEEPRRQFAGEGDPARTNRRFHFLSAHDPAKRLSTAFDSVTLYGEDPAVRPDIYGKVGESGVSICCLEDMKILYAGFDLCSPSTSVSMTINGPAPMILAYFLNTAIDQQIDLKKKSLNRELTNTEYDAVKASTLSQVRGTVQADILKEDQAQNTCIFSTDFALKMMGDVQEYFIDHKVRNFYSVSISGYHIAEAGANPISQLAFTLANGFTYVEYYLSRGMKIDDFAPNLSFFFSNGLDPEYSVMGRVARRIWAVAMRELYGASERSQKLKYHIQTSGRSLHAQEIDFNDIRTTLQALLAVYDHCNSLHTNAYDEAITTPTEESVRRAMAIQMIINREFGTTKNENPNQGSYFFEELTDLVEEAVLTEFLRINERGGVLGAMETQYQRGQIQDESLYYERLKHTGELPIIGVNTFIDPKTLQQGYVAPKIELARATGEEKMRQLKQAQQVQSRDSQLADKALNDLKSAALAGNNVFAALMSASRYCTLGQMTGALYEVGGKYRRNV
ncbi:MAG: methylmalonyl-CoA mutase [Bdellovibrionales bacterium CG10_big_fil_rev_8_21_14_0_10_45_34]|nr:MAG: methylmalonyl-CoA mutase [Bdellovibrionales bacterium CG10_big_fil_rev_8_21_14_0_10_45_34]